MKWNKSKDILPLNPEDYKTKFFLVYITYNEEYSKYYNIYTKPLEPFSYVVPAFYDYNNKFWILIESKRIINALVFEKAEYIVTHWATVEPPCE